MALSPSLMNKKKIVYGILINRVEFEGISKIPGGLFQIPSLVGNDSEVVQCLFVFGILAQQGLKNLFGLYHPVPVEKRLSFD